jgi:hypothetical protein
MTDDGTTRERPVNRPGIRPLARLERTTASRQAMRP